MSTRKYIRTYTPLNLYLHLPFWRLQPWSVQTTRVVCTNFSWSLYRLRRGFEFRKSARDIFIELSAGQSESKFRLIYECRRHGTSSKPRVEWGQSPIWNPWYTQTKTEWAPTRSGTNRASIGCALRLCRPYGAHSAFVCVYPGFHFGLCPHYTLGYEKVSCLKALIPASPNKSNIQTVKFVRKKLCIGQILPTLRCKIIGLTSIDREEPCKGDTLSKPRAQALGQSLKHIYVSPFRGGTNRA